MLDQFKASQKPLTMHACQEMGDMTAWGTVLNTVLTPCFVATQIASYTFP